MPRKIWVGVVPNYGLLTSYEYPDAKLRDFIDVKELAGNPYYDEFMALDLVEPSWDTRYITSVDIRVDNIIRRAKARDTMTKLYAWAVPTPAVIEYMRGYLQQGIYEIGAGSGYWARMITQSWWGLNYYAYDNYSSHGFTHRYYNVSDEPLLSMESYRSLLLCWPSYKSSFAFEAIRDLQPRHVFYVGEGHGGCTADDAFHEHLEAHYEQVEGTPDVEQHQHLNDRFYHYKRKVGGPEGSITVGSPTSSENDDANQVKAT
jgi:hypothetical protein